jgi:class 3 adenylate cyclase
MAITKRHFRRRDAARAGEVAPRRMRSDGTKIGGIAVHIGARVAMLAGSGEVLVSSTVKDLVTGSGLRFADRGTKPLKGVPGKCHIFAVER